MIATPGRFLHLVVEMKLNLRHVELMVCDEADRQVRGHGRFADDVRLFELGFEVQIREIMSRLPPIRQNLLFSATLPSSVAEFAKASLVNPALVRLDTDQKLSPDLKLEFLQVKPVEKDAGLLILVDNILKIPSANAINADSPQAIIFVATKHHVDFVSGLLAAAGFECSFVYGSLDQKARSHQLAAFRAKRSSLLVVTDVAARGIDIPVLDHVVNYDLPSGPRIFVHRVGRTARAGRSGSAWSLVTPSDLPFLHDIDTSLNVIETDEDTSNIGVIPQSIMDEKIEYVNSTLIGSESHLVTTREVMLRGQKMYERSRPKASKSSYDLARQMVKDAASPHRVFAEEVTAEQGRTELLSIIDVYRPESTVLEIGHRNTAGTSERLRAKTSGRMAKVDSSQPVVPHSASTTKRSFGEGHSAAKTKSFKDDSFYLDHAQSTEQEDRMWVNRIDSG